MKTLLKGLLNIGQYPTSESIKNVTASVNLNI